MKKARRKKGAHLGQHLLTSSSVARIVAEASGAKSGVRILEIGPGKGMLTKELIALGAKVTAIEKDPVMVAFLREEFKEVIKNKKLTLIEGDARNELVSPTLSVRAPYSVAANIPYYITGELIRLFLSSNPKPHTIALLVQKEVAERIVSKKKESILSLSVKVYGTPRYVRTVKAGSFNPPPSVDSAILAIDNISSKNVRHAQEEHDFFTVVKTGFAQKRKTLIGNLSALTPKDVLREIFEKIGLEEKVRAEDVPLESWLRLTQEIRKNKALGR